MSENNNNLETPISRKQFENKFEELVKDVVSELPSTFEMPPQAVSWIHTLIEHSVPGGKMNRGMTVVHTLQLLKGKDITPTQYEHATILGWCIEWLQGFFLVADDLMDQSLTRRGKTCWYKMKRPLKESTDEDKVGVIATNDSFILLSTMFRVLKKYFRTESYYVDLIELFNEVIYQTELGQLLDLTSQPSATKVQPELFTLDLYKKIVKYKTAFYSFYLPVALALIIAGNASDEALVEAKGILLAMGEYFQIQDDYLDCYGDPSVIGKVGRDIEENKCGWLIIQAFIHANDEQKQILKDNYGKDNADNVAVVKSIFKDINLTKIFTQYEDDSYRSLCANIEKTSIVPKEVYNALLAKIYKRKL